MSDYSRSNGVLSPSFEEADLFLEALAGKYTRYTFQTFDDVEVWDEAKQKAVKRMDKSLARVYHGTFDQHKKALAALNAKGAGVFVTVNETDLKGRKKENIVKVRAVFVDLDGAPIQPIKDLPEDLQPQIIIESSPNKWHSYWLVNNCTLEQFPDIQRALAAKFDGDVAVNNIDRVMRLTGFSHNKDESFITRIAALQKSNFVPFSVNKLIVGLGLNEQKTAESDRYNPNNTYNSNCDDFTNRRSSTADLMAELKSALDYLSCEDYHDWVRQAMRLKSLGQNTGLDLFIWWSSKSAKFDRTEALKKWDSLEADRTGYKAIFSEAQRNGWINPLSRKNTPKTHNSNTHANHEDIDNGLNSDSNEWQDPDNNTIETHRNAPRGNAAMLYGIFGEFGRAAAKNTEVNPYAAAINLMIYLSASVGRGIYFYIGNDVHHVRLYGLHIGRSSRGQKGGAHSLLNRIIIVIAENNYELLPSRHTGGLSSKEGLAALIHDGYMQGKEEVAPITDKRLFIRESEFSNVMHQAARNGNTLSAGLRDAWDGVGIQPATKLKGTWASHPHIAIAGACTPVELLALTTKNDVSNGFLNRFIIFWAERTKLIPFPQSTPIETVNLLATKIKAIIQFAKGDYVWDKNPSLASEDNRQITLSDDAKRAYGALYINVFPKYNDGDKVAALTERKAPYLLRMAALFAISDFSLVIEGWHINAAYEWVKYWHESVKFIFNDAAEEVKNNEISDHASKIVNYLASKDKGYQATRTELSSEVFKRHLDSKALDEALNTLITSTPPKIEVIEGNRSDGATGKKPKLYTLCELCELSELSELTTAARVTPFANNCELLRTINDDCEVTKNDSRDEKLSSQYFADVRINTNPTAVTNFAKLANFAEVKIEDDSEDYDEGVIE